MIKIVEVTLRLRVDEDEYDHPRDWDWPDLLDLRNEDVQSVRVKDIEEVDE